MVISMLILIAGVSLVVLGGFAKKRVESFVWLILGCILITYALASIIAEVEASKGIRKERQQHQDVQRQAKGELRHAMRSNKLLQATRDGVFSLPRSRGLADVTGPACLSLCR